MILEKFMMVFATNADKAKKEAREVGAVADEVERKLKNPKKQINEMEAATTDLITKLTAAVGAFATFDGLKNMALQAQQYTFEMGRAERITGVSATRLDAWGATISKLTGADGKEFTNWLQSVTQEYAKMGMADRIPQIPEWLLEQADKFKEMSRADAFQVGGQMGLSPNMILTLREGREHLEAMLKAEEDRHLVTEQSIAQAERLNAQLVEWKRGAIEFGAAFMPILSAVGELISGIGAIGNAVIGKPLEWLFSLGAKPQLGGATSSPVTKNLAAIQADEARANPGGARAAARKESFDFWRSRGYTAEQAAGMVAQEQAESNFNSSSKIIDSDGKLHGGAFQWSPERRRQIAAGTGIDVLNATHAQQLQAAAWELQHGEAAANRNLLGASSPESAGIAGIGFERPDDRDGSKARYRAMLARQIYTDMMLQNGQATLKTADSMPGISGVATMQGGNSVKIDQVIVNTQASDAHGIARDIKYHLNNELNTAAANADDGFTH